jgi:hypothetical protein
MYDDDGEFVSAMLADRLLRLAVERGGSLIEQQDRRILQEGARDGRWPLPPSS